MDYWSYLPFVQFIRDDKETVTIMAEAMQIVPRVCKILQTPRINGSTQQSAAGPATSGRGVAPSSSPLPPPGSLNLQDIAAASSLVALSRKRKRNDESTSSTAMYPLKKRRLMEPGSSTASGITGDGNHPGPSGTASNTSRNESTNPSVSNTMTSNIDSGDQLSLVRLKLKQDYDTFVDQVGQLASLERQKNTLIQKFVQLCTAASLSRNAGTSGPATTNTNTATTGPGATTTATATTSSSSTAVAAPAAVPRIEAKPRDVDNDHSYATTPRPSSS